MCDEKVKLLERILKWLTGAKEIRYHTTKPFSSKWGWIELVDVEPDELHTHGWDDGLHFDWNSEVYDDEFVEKLFDKPPTRIIAEIWYDVDPYARIEELEKQLKEAEQELSVHPHEE